MTEAPQDSSPTAAASARRFPWRRSIAPYEIASWPRAIGDLASSLLPSVALLALMFLSFDQVPLWATLALGIPTAGFLLRTFIVFHDCAHGSFTPSPRVNLWLGRLCALLVFQPYASWRHSHALHHGSAGDLDRRGTGDVSTLTLEEYLNASWRTRFGYRLFRNPLVMFGVGPMWALMIGPRIWSGSMGPRQRRSVITTDLVLAAVFGLQIWLFGWQAWLAVQMPAALVAGSAGVWLFYVQHQFEEVYWESGERWTYADAALRGSSYLKLGGVLRFFSGNIGLHHVHHLSARVPNYNLQRAHDELEIFRGVPVMTMGRGIASVRLKVIDPDAGRMMSWSDVRRHRAALALSPPVTS